jgi:glycosyltransferase involved in cell wall biosynthesis
MRILIISAVFPPHVKGGAEISAYNLAAWLSNNGHEVGVLTTARNPSEVTDGVVEDGLKIWRVMMPRLYTAFEATSAPGWKKPIWHTQDMFDPRNITIVDRVLNEFRPDIANVHFIQGMGYNALKALGKRDIPAVFTLHDLGLACIKMAMFVDGKECQSLCRACDATAKLKMSYLRSIRRLGFISPSRNNLDRVSTFQPITDYPTAHILNANRYPQPRMEWQPSERPRLLFVGRMDDTKGVHLLLEAIDPLAKQFDFTLKMVGSGPAEEELRQAYRDRAWLSFTGQIPIAEVTDIMATSDLLFVPSIWQENSPGVVIQALAVSLPVMGSDKGGIPELVTAGENGILVPPGDVSAWRSAIEKVLADPASLAGLRARAAQNAANFDQDVLGAKVVSFFQQVVGA